MSVKHFLPLASDGQRLLMAVRRPQHARSGVGQVHYAAWCPGVASALAARMLTGSHFAKVLAVLPSKQTHNRIYSRSAHQQEPMIFLSAQSHFCCSDLPFSHIITLSTTVLGILFFCWGSCVDLPPPWLTSVRVFSANGTRST